MASLLRNHRLDNSSYLSSFFQHPLDRILGHPLLPQERSPVPRPVTRSHILRCSFLLREYENLGRRTFSPNCAQAVRKT